MDGGRCVQFHLAQFEARQTLRAQNDVLVVGRDCHRGCLWSVLLLVAKDAGACGCLPSVASPTGCNQRTYKINCDAKWR